MLSKCDKDINNNVIKKKNKKKKNLMKKYLILMKIGLIKKFKFFY